MLTKSNTGRSGFTLVEIMIVVATIALLAVIAIPNYIRARKRSQATQILEDLRNIDSAVSQYAIETGKKSGDTYAWQDCANYVKTGTRLYVTMSTGQAADILGNPFSSDSLIDSGNLGIGAVTYMALSDVAPASFWSPYTSNQTF